MKFAGPQAQRRLRWVPVDIINLPLGGFTLLKVPVLGTPPDGISEVHGSLESLAKNQFL